jgi:hypothetical protein
VTEGLGNAQHAEVKATGGETSRTVATVLQRYEDKGYTAQLVPLEGGTLRVADSREEVSAEGLTVDEFERLEGTSDPDDMSLIAAVQLPGNGRKGIVVLGYGPNASPSDADVLRQLPI